MSEADELKRSGAKAQPNSGRGTHKKGDGVIDNAILVDVKEYGKSFSLSMNSWAKVSTDAARQGLLAALKIVLGKEGSFRLRLWVIDDSMMNEYLELRRRYDDEIQNKAD